MEEKTFSEVVKDLRIEFLKDNFVKFLSPRFSVFVKKEDVLGFTVYSDGSCCVRIRCFKGKKLKPRLGEFMLSPDGMSNLLRHSMLFVTDISCEEI